MFSLIKKKKPIIVTIHGFGKMCQHEFDPLTQYLKNEKYDVIQFDIYDLYDQKDTDPKIWIRRCEAYLQKAFKQSRDVILVGFSMGGVIASYLASIYPVKKLILIAPAFQYLDLYKIGHASLSTLKNLGKKDTKLPSSLQTKTFMTIVDQYKESIYHVECPILILHGTKDEVISCDVSCSVYKKIKDHSRLVLIEGGRHRMLYDHQGYEGLCFHLIKDMIKENLF
ncbi:alpha/beta fold hydrolase [uncultured Faecalicoccus sp.]|uniref:alpha/beta hydrolase n=1 Tax=uncultured Faecalicoccus sp. TaxID=1971760 RepID=UPI0026315294|nr:alpha/beta fold hydrolase [uncultured Faecalicoccus sp.]